MDTIEKRVELLEKETIRFAKARIKEYNRELDIVVHNAIRYQEYLDHTPSEYFERLIAEGEAYQVELWKRIIKLTKKLEKLQATQTDNPITGGDI